MTKARTKAAPKAAPKDEQPTDEAKTDDTVAEVNEAEAKTDAPAEEPQAPAGYDAPEFNPDQTDGDKEPEPEEAADEGEKTPAAAAQEPPKEQSAPKPAPTPPSAADAAAERIKVLGQKPRITYSDDSAIPAGDIDGLFRDAPGGIKHCTARLIEHTQAERYRRPSRVLLYAKGAPVSAYAAKAVQDRLRAQLEEDEG